MSKYIKLIILSFKILILCYLTNFGKFEFQELIVSIKDVNELDWIVRHSQPNLYFRIGWFTNPN